MSPLAMGKKCSWLQKRHPLGKPMEAGLPQCPGQQGLSAKDHPMSDEGPSYSMQVRGCLSPLTEPPACLLRLLSKDHFRYSDFPLQKFSL